MKRERTARRGTGCGLLLALVLCACEAATPTQATPPPSTPLRSAPLVPPSGFTAAIAHTTREARDCPGDAPPFTTALDFPSRYEGSDSARDDLNPAADREYKRLTAPITALEKGLTQQVDDYVQRGSAASLACALRLLREWSQARALQGPAVTHTGKSMRKWALASLSAAYLRLRFSVSQPLAADPALARAVEQWLEALANQVVEEWRDQPLDKVNNHEYWAAWAVMATSVVLGRQDLFDWAMRLLNLALTQVDSQGYLPNELRRDTRALSYHNYSLAPLTMLAAFAKANGLRPDGERAQALSRLVRRVLEGVDDPAVFERRTGKRQKLDGLDEAAKFAWLEPYCWTYDCPEALRSRRDRLRPLKTTRLGGNLTELFSPLPPPQAHLFLQESPS